MLKANGMRHEFLAVNYRTDGDRAQGCWRGFRTQLEADYWLFWRTHKTAQSPQGTAVFASYAEIEACLLGGSCKSLRMALRNYQEYCHRVRVKSRRL